MIFNKSFGPYSLVKKVAMGGMAEVYLALKRKPAPFCRTVALKCILEHVNDDRRHVEMFYNEARLGGLFRHPNLIQVFDAAQYDGRHTLVMEYVAGQTLEDLLKRLEKSGQQMPVPLALHILQGVASGLAYAHEVLDVDGSELHLVHRDISPANILIGYDGGVKLFDFGVAVAAARGEAGGELAGKTAYMSPEQVRGKAVDGRSDIFSLGIVMHELLTGKRLFQRDNQMKTLRAVTDDEVPAPSSVRAGLADADDAIVLKALARPLDERWANARQLVHALDARLHDAGQTVDETDLAAFVQDLFRDEVDEIDAVIRKALNAPEQNDATIDLATFDLRSTRAQAAVTGRVQAERGEGLEEFKAAADSVASPTGSPVLRDEAEAAVRAQLERERRARSRMTVIMAISMVVLAAAAFFGGRALAPSVVEPAPAVAPAATASTGAVSVETEPAGAAIRVNGEVRPEVTPTQLLLADGVEVQIELSLPGYLAHTASVTPVGDGDAQTIRHAFEVDVESPSAPIGSVRITYLPEDAQVFLDGELRGSTSPVTLESLTLNREYTLRFEKENYETLYHAFRVDSADLLDIQLVLAEERELGVFAIRSSPSGAQVLINEVEQGVTPLEDLQLPAGRTYTIEVAASGYNRWRRQIQVRSGVNDPIVADLQRPGGRAPEPARGGNEEPPPRATERPTTPTPTTEEPPAPTQPRYELLE